MREKTDESFFVTALRRKAEQIVSEQRVLPPSGSKPNAHRLLHELQVHRVELEMQNEELLQTRDGLESELAQYTDLYEFSPTSYFTLDAAGKILRTNLAGANLLGVGRSVLLGSNFGLFVSRRDQETWAGFLTQLLAAQVKITREFTLEANLGRHHVLAEGVGDASGRQCWLSLVDITERKRAEERSKKGTALLRNIFNNIPIGMFESTPAGQVLYVNEALAGMLRYDSAEELIAAVDRSSASEVLYADPGQRARFLDQVAGNGGKGKIFENRYRCRDGSVIETLMSFSLHPDPLSGQKRLYGFVQDVTERKRMEKILRQIPALAQRRAAELDATLNAISEGLIVFGPDKQIQRMSPLAERVFGYTPDEMALPADKRLSLLSFTDAEGKNLSPEELPGFRALRGDRVKGEVLCVQRHGGAAVWALLNAAPIRDASEAVMGSIVTFQDITERMAAERALQKSEERYRHVVEDQIELICRYLPDGRISFVNDAYLRYYGLDREKALWNNFVPNIPETDQEAIQQHLQSLTPDNPAVNFTHCILKPDGEVRWQEWTHRAIYSPAGELVEHQAVGTDVTERKRAEEALSDSKNLYQSLVENLPLSIMTFDQTGRVNYVNQFHLKTLALSNHEMDYFLGRSIFELPSIVSSGLGRELEPLLEGTPVFLDAQFIPRQSGGKPGWQSIKGIPLWKDGRLTGGILIREDITERKLAEETLRASEAKYSAFFQSSIDGFFLTSPDGRIHQANPAACRMLGFSEEELCRGGRALILDESDPAFQAFQDNRFKDGSASAELVLRRKDGSTILTETTSSIYGHAQGDLRACVIWRDVTGRKRAEKFREDVERIIRHDIKGPLSSLHTMAQLMLDDGMDDGFREMAPGLMHGVQQVINLVDSTEKITRMEKGGYRLQADWFDPEDVLLNIKTSLGGLTEIKRVRLVTAVTPDAASRREKQCVLGELFLIENMLTNLVKNAVEASPRDRDVVVSCRIEPREIRFDIHNQGAIPEAVKSRFFEKYVTHGKSNGTGLGTYSAQLIAKAHGGRIAFNTSEAEGTTVTAILPRGANQIGSDPENVPARSCTEE